jgi:hypothetical protein|tara:strand:+ start:200 stop:538 length:339 start_codon:yes stop_codon:yes gene_type:complete
MKMLKDVLKWQEAHTERMRKLMGVSHNTHLWMSFIKGLLIGIIITILLSGCASVKPKLLAEEKPSLDAIGKVLGCVFAPASEECERMRKEQNAAPEDFCTDDGCPEFEELSK